MANAFQPTMRQPEQDADMMAPQRAVSPLPVASTPVRNAFVNRTAPAPAPMAPPEPQPRAAMPFATPAPQKSDPFRNAFKSFATGFLGQDAIDKIDERKKTEAKDKLTKTLAWLKQTATVPAEQREAFTMQNAERIMADTGMDPRNAAGSYSDDMLKQGIAAISAQLGELPEKPDDIKYQAVNLGNGGYGVMNQQTGEVRIDREPTADLTKAAPPAQWRTTIVGDRVVAYNPQDPTQKQDMGPAPKRQAGSGGGLTPYQQAQIDRQKAADAAKAKKENTQRDINLTSLNDGISRIDNFLNSKGFEGLYGSWWGISKPENLMNQEEINSLAMLNQIGGEAFLAGVAKMRGTGPLSDNEGKRVMAAVQRLTDRRQDAKAARAAAAEFKAAMQGLIASYQKESAAAGGGPAIGADPSAQFDSIESEIDAALGGGGGGLSPDEQAELEALRAELGQ